MLGTEQSGHMVNVGYELYCKMVDDAVRALEGEIVNEESEETLVELKAAAYIPETYVSSESLKLQMYKRIASIRSADDEEEIIDELTDRFGDVPKATMNLIKISHIRYLAGLMSITEVKQNDNKITLSFDAKNPLSGFALANATDYFGQRLFIHGGKQPFLRLTLAALPGASRKGHRTAAAGRQTAFYQETANLNETLKLLEILAENRKSKKENI